MIAVLVALVFFAAGLLVAAAAFVPLLRASADERERLTASHASAMDVERRRVDDLYRLLESKAAPVETMAYLAPAPDPGQWAYDSTGLVGYPVADLGWDD